MTTTAAAATAVALTANPASAAPANWTVTPGGAVTWANTRPLMASNMDSGASPFVCPSSVVSGTMPGGAGLPGTGIATLTSVIFDGCRATMGFDTTITADNLPWSFNAIGYNAATQVSTGTLTGFAVTVSHFGCTYTIGAPGGGSGTISATYTNTNPDIGISTVDLSGTDIEIQATSGAGCGALYEPGHDIAFHGQYGVVPPGGTITSP